MENYRKAEKDYMDGMKYKDIAEKYGTTMNTVKSWKKRYGWNRKKTARKKEKNYNRIPKKEPIIEYEEKLKEISGTCGKYIVSNLGKVYRKNKSGEYVLCKTSKNDKGYVYFKMCIAGNKKTVSMHRTVA